MIKYLILSSFLFLCGVSGLFLTKKHVLLWLLCIEIIFLSVNYNFIVFSVFLDDLLGQYYVLSIITVAAGEAAIGLAILVLFYRIRGGISLDLISLLKS
jgi:NADH-quinone oxidoreductase subunit K